MFLLPPYVELMKAPPYTDKHQGHQRAGEKHQRVEVEGAKSGLRAEVRRCGARFDGNLDIFKSQEQSRKASFIPR